MTNSTPPLRTVSKAPMAAVHMAPTSPNPKSALIGLACILGFISLSVLYWKIIGF